MAITNNNTASIGFEQQNGAVVRVYVGYNRLVGLEEQALLAAVYQPLTPLLNFFMPTQKLKNKIRIGSKEIKVYDVPKSPFQWLMESRQTDTPTPPCTARLSGKLETSWTATCIIYK